MAKRNNAGLMRKSTSFLVPALAAVVLAGCGKSSGPDPYALMEGETIYKMECSTCHGARMEGQGPRTDGASPAPALDASGKIFGAPRDVLLAIVKQGNERTPEVHAYGKKMTEGQMQSVVVFIESRWAAAGGRKDK